MKRTKLLALAAVTSLMILASTLVIAAQPTEEAAGSSGAQIYGGIGMNLKR